MNVKQLVDNKVVAVLRHANQDNIVSAARALREGGIRCIEITVENPGGISAINALSKSNLDVMVGAGTVLDVFMAKLAIEAGATFLVSPVLNEQVLALANEHDVLAVPGVLTPNEIMQAIQLKAPMVKVFPASAMGVSYLKSIQAPLPKIPMMATGGITLDNAMDYLKVVDAVGLGSQLIDLRKDLDESYLQEVIKNTTNLMDSIR